MSTDLYPSPEPSFEDIFKAYDIRGTVPDELDARIVYAVGVGFARFVLAQAVADKRVVVARDIRESGVELTHALSGAYSPSVSAWSTSAWPRPTSSTSRRGGSSSRGRCSRPRTTRPTTTG